MLPFNRLGSAHAHWKRYWFFFLVYSSLLYRCCSCFVLVSASQFNKKNTHFSKHKDESIYIMGTQGHTHQGTIRIRMGRARARWHMHMVLKKKGKTDDIIMVEHIPSPIRPSIHLISYPFFWFPFTFKTNPPHSLIRSERTHSLSNIFICYYYRTDNVSPLN